MTRLWRSNLICTLILLALLAIGILTYGFSLRLPLFLDDMPHFRWLQWQTLTGILRSSRGLGHLGYYRPLPFLLWKALWFLQGQLHPPTLHAVNLGLHLLNTILVWGIVKGQCRERGTVLGMSSALLFLLYPFSYQAVPWVGSLTHPLVAALILGSLRLYQMCESRSSPWLWAGSIGLAFLAPFAHETGILAAPLLSLLLLTSEERPSVREVLRRTRFHWLGALIGLTVWLAMPKNVPSPHVWNLEARYQNGVYLLQGLAYPVAPLARNVLAAGWGLDDLQSILLVSVPAVLLWGLLLWKAGGGRPLALALGWFSLAVTPVWLMLGFEYVIDGPRLLYTASFGAALFWAIPLAIPWQSRQSESVGRAIALILVLGIALSGYRFIRERAAMYEQLRRAVAQFVQSVRSVTDPGTVLWVNCPQFLAPRDPTFAVGHEGVPLVYTGQLDDLFWVNTGEEREIKGMVLPDVQRPWRYHYASEESFQTIESLQSPLRQAAGIILTDYEREDIALHLVGELEVEGTAPQTPFLADWDDQVRLLSATVEREGKTLWVVLRWQSLQPLSEDTTVFLHLLAPSGQLVCQRDGYPLMGLSRPTAWRPGDIWRDVRPLCLPESLPAGEYTVNVGLYPVSGGPRLEATDPMGRHFPDDAAPIATVILP